MRLIKNSIEFALIHPRFSLITKVPSWLPLLVAHFQHGHFTLAQVSKSLKIGEALSSLSLGSKLIRSKYDLSLIDCKFELWTRVRKYFVYFCAGAADIAGGGGRDRPHVPVFKTVGRGEGEYRHFRACNLAPKPILWWNQGLVCSKSEFGEPSNPLSHGLPFGKSHLVMVMKKSGTVYWWMMHGINNNVNNGIKNLRRPVSKL